MTHPATPICADLVQHTIGKPWSERATGPDAYDCWGLAQKVQAEAFGRPLPFAADILADGQGLRDVIDTIKASELQRRWQAVPRPRPGDMVLMGRHAQISHVGVWIDAGPGLVGCLHCVRGAGVLMQGMAELRTDWARLDFRRCVDPALHAIEGANIERVSHMAPRPVLVVVNDPLNPLQNAEFAALQVGTRAGDAVAHLADLSSRWLCLNDVPLLRHNPATGEGEWDRRVGPHDVLWAFPPMPAGDDGGSATLATVLSIAATIAAPYAAAAIGGGALGTASSLTFGGKLLSAGIAIGANLLISSFIPTPRMPRLANADPTYSFGAIGNQMRPGATVPRIYGTMKRQPDLLSAPWAKYEDNDQLVHVLLCVGHGAYELQEFGFGDTAVWTKDAGLTGALADFDFEVVAPGEQVTLFPGTVEVSDEVGGIELPPVDPENGASPVGPYVAVTSGAAATELVMDFVFPYGLFDVGSTTSPATVDWKVEAQLIDDAGEAVGFWQELGTISRTEATTTPIRLTRRFSVAAGRYRVQVTRTNASGLSGAGKDTLVWAGLRAHLTGDVVYDDVTALALRVRADATSSSLQDWYVTATAVLPHFDQATGELVTGPTEAIEAGALDIVRQSYGMARSDDEIDLEALWAVSQTWAARGDVLCTAIESEIGAWDALSLVLEAGRTKPQLLGGMVTFIRDEARSAAPRLITEADMVRGSFSVERLHARQDSPNAVTMRYRDRDGVMRSLLCVPPGVADPRPADIFASNMVDAAQVWREGHYRAASSNLRRRFVSWVMLGGGRALIRGQLVAVAHRRPAYGAPARIVAMDWPELTLSAPPGLAAGETGWLALALPDGVMWGPVRCTVLAGSDCRRVAIDEADLDDMLTGIQTHLYPAQPRDWIITEADRAASGVAPQTLAGRQSEPTRAVLGADRTAHLTAIVLETIPRDDGQVEVLAVEEVAAVHTAEDVPLPETALPEALTNSDAPAWDGVVIRGSEVADAARPDRVDFTVTGPAVQGAVRYLAEYASQIDAATWVDGGSAATPIFDGPSLDGEDVYIRVAAAGPVLRGPWQYFRTQMSIMTNGLTQAVPVDAP